MSEASADIEASTAVVELLRVCALGVGTESPGLCDLDRMRRAMFLTLQALTGLGLDDVNVLRRFIASGIKAIPVMPEARVRWAVQGFAAHERQRVAAENPGVSESERECRVRLLVAERLRDLGLDAGEADYFLGLLPRIADGQG